LYLGLGKQFVIVVATLVEAVATLVEAVPTIYSKLLTLQWTRYRSMHGMGGKARHELLFPQESGAGNASP